MKFHIHVIDDPDNHSFYYVIKFDIKFLLIIFLNSLMIYRLNNKLYINLNFAFKNLKIINIRKQYILNQKYLNEINYFKENRLI